MKVRCFDAWIGGLIRRQAWNTWMLRMAMLHNACVFQCYIMEIRMAIWGCVHLWFHREGWYSPRCWAATTSPAQADTRPEHTVYYVVRKSNQQSNHRDCMRCKNMETGFRNQGVVGATTISTVWTGALPNRVANLEPMCCLHGQGGEECV